MATVKYIAWVRGIIIARVMIAAVLLAVALIVAVAAPGTDQVGFDTPGGTSNHGE